MRAFKLLYLRSLIVGTWCLISSMGMGVVAYANTFPQQLLADQDKFLRTVTAHADVMSMSLSNDGHFLAGLIPRPKSPDILDINVWRTLEENWQHPKNRERLPYVREDIQWLSWIGGGRLLLSLRQKGLVLYDAHTKRLRPLIEGFTPRPGELLPLLLAQLVHDPQNLIMQWEDPDVKGFPAVYRVNALDGSSEKIIGAFKPVVRWWAAPDGQIYLGEGYKSEKHYVFGRGTGGGWQQIIMRDYFDDPLFSILSVESAGATALVLSAEGVLGNKNAPDDKRALWRMDTRTGEMLTKLASDKRFDVQGALIDPVSYRTVGHEVVRLRRDTHILQPALRKKIQSVREILGLSNTDHIIQTSVSFDGAVRLYKISPLYSHAYYAVQSNNSATLKLYGFRRAFSHYSTDGVWIPVKAKRKKVQSRLPPMHAVLSVPKAGPTGKAVVIPHGGPVRRANGNYKPLVSWLTKQGYTVLLPNFRGSLGYGRRWRQDGYAEWGGVMQDDLRSAALWLIESGYARPDQTCSVGGSYGGYASMMAVIKDADVFQCGVSLNGVMSLPMLVEDYQSKRFASLIVPRVRGRLSERRLMRLSPLHLAKIMNVPVLILHGTQDNNVTFLHSHLMAARLGKYNKDFTFIPIEGAGHSLTQPRDRQIYYRETLLFLERHIGNKFTNEQE